jgi:glucose-6-phosphate 1-dehydrogenase
MNRLFFAHLNQLNDLKWAVFAYARTNISQNQFNKAVNAENWQAYMQDNPAFDSLVWQELASNIRTS